MSEDRDNMIPKTTIQRLPLYYRCLQKLAASDEEVVSSKNLGETLGIPPTQVRKDLSYYGEFGRRGVGYEVSSLIKDLERILGLDTTWKIALVGAGNLGRALVNYEGFRRIGLEIVKVFDADLGKIGHRVEGLEVRGVNDFERVVREAQIEIGVIAVPASSAQEVADRMIESGITVIWNFAPVRVRVPEEVVIRNEDLSVGLISLVYQLIRK